MNRTAATAAKFSPTTTRTRYIERGFAKVAPCDCSTGAIHEKAEAYLDALLPVWKCRNCGAESKRRVRVAGVVAGTGGVIRLDREGNIL